MIEEKPIDIEQIEPQEPTKNKWLYPTDEFGKLEKDMVYESKTYQSGIRETEMDSLKIITVKQKTKYLKKKP